MPQPNAPRVSGGRTPGEHSPSAGGPHPGTPGSTPGHRATASRTRPAGHAARRASGPGGCRHRWVHHPGHSDARPDRRPPPTGGVPRRRTAPRAWLAPGPGGHIVPGGAPSPAPVAPAQLRARRSPSPAGAPRPGAPAPRIDGHAKRPGRTPARLRAPAIAVTRGCARQALRRSPGADGQRHRPRRAPPPSPAGALTAPRTAESPVPGVRPSGPSSCAAGSPGGTGCRRGGPGR